MYLMSKDVLMMERWRYVWVWEYLVYEKGYRDGILDVILAMTDGNMRKKSMGRDYVHMMVMDVIRVFGDELSEMRGIYDFMSDEKEGEIKKNPLADIKPKEIPTIKTYL